MRPAPKDGKDKRIGLRQVGVSGASMRPAPKDGKDTQGYEGGVSRDPLQ